MYLMKSTAIRFMAFIFSLVINIVYASVYIFMQFIETIIINEPIRLPINHQPHPAIFHQPAACLNHLLQA